MRKIDITLFSIFIILIISNFIFFADNLGQIWKKWHVNSLIGLQKFIEDSLLQKILNFELWYVLFLPLLELPIFMLITIIFLVITIYVKYK
jgi:hypothetical protein